tara:strand:+ start:2987 stop:4315 length:1329 start_codon:yes stop_codon:yes gene_type:complete
MSIITPVVAVLGRPNVGKSTLFNRIVGGHVAIVDDSPGVTRDRNFHMTDWAGHHFYLVDTGGVTEGSNEQLDNAIQEQAYAAMAEADLIIFIVDGKSGVHPLDKHLAEILRKGSSPVLLVVNKMDNLPEDQNHLDFWSLGIGDPIPVSAISGKGSGDLLDLIVSKLPDQHKEEKEEKDNIRIAVVGKPNVGKSSFVNRLFGKERSVVSEIPGTTRDPIDSQLRYNNKALIFVDTAGLRRQSRIKESIEYYSTLRTAKVVREADVCLVLVDATEPIHVQDLKIIEQAWEAGAGLIIIVNKWDLIDKDHQTALEFEKELKDRAPFLKWIPTIFTSAISGQRVRKCLDMILEIQKERNRRITTSEVNEALERILLHQPPPHSRGRRVKIRYGTQVSVAPPTFIFFTNLPKALPDHYIRYVHNNLRDRWGFIGTPIRIRFKENKTS